MGNKKKVKEIRFLDRCLKCRWGTKLECFKCKEELRYCRQSNNIINNYTDDLYDLKTWDECKLFEPL